MAKRRRFSPEFRARLVPGVLSGGESATEVCREHGLKPDRFSKCSDEAVRSQASEIGDGRLSLGKHRQYPSRRRVGAGKSAH